MTQLELINSLKLKLEKGYELLENLSIGDENYEIILRSIMNTKRFIEYEEMILNSTNN